jgi:hypothetical protein
MRGGREGAMIGVRWLNALKSESQVTRSACVSHALRVVQLPVAHQATCATGNHALPLPQLTRSAWD